MHLECHSVLSFGAGCLRPEELPRLARERGMEALALVDDRGLYGMVEFYRAARAEGLKPILGSRFPALGGTVVLARGRRGFTELSRLVTLDRLGPGDPALAARGPGRPQAAAKQEPAARTDAAERLKALQAALQELEDCHLILPGEAALRLALPEGARSLGRRALGRDRCSVGLAPALDKAAANRLFRASRELGLPILPHYPVYYGDSGDLGLHRTLRAIHENLSLDALEASGHYRRKAHFRGREELLAGFADLPQAGKRLEQVLGDCELELRLGALHLPSCDTPGGRTPELHLRELCLQGLARRYPAPGPSRAGTPGAPTSRAEARGRLERELAVIGELRFADYFLAVHSIAGFARAEGLPMVGRGSAANSLVSYCLGLTEVDPIRHRLFFERFLNPLRTSPPDIDLDFSWTDRDRVLAQVYEHFGHAHTAMICTLVTYGLRGALREAAKTRGIHGPELEALTRDLPRFSSDWEEELRENPERSGASLEREPLRSLLPLVRRLIGLPRHLGIHAGGIVISPFPITELVPLERSRKGFVVTQLDMHPVEELGLLKIDLLAQRGLGVYSDLRKLLKRRSAEGRRLRQPPHCVYELERDPELRRMLREGRTMGCFYIESPGMRSLLRKLRCEDFEILVAASSIIRPGVSESGMMQAYIERHRDPSRAEYLHPLLERILDETYGVMVYQEDVIKVVHALAGMDLGEADLLRRAMSGKARSSEAMGRLEQRFREGCRGKGMSEEAIAEIWRQISSFAGYAFCKAHSASFAVLSLRVGWLKAHYPADFMAAVLSNQGGYYSTAAYVQEARRLGLRILPPCVQRGEAAYTGEGREIRVGLRQIRSLSGETCARILSERERAPFRNFRDFRRRCGAGRDELEQLVLSGACDALGESAPKSCRPGFLWLIRLEATSEAAGGPARGKGAAPARGGVQEALFGELAEPAPRGSGSYGRLEMWMHERKALGFGLGRHPIELYDFGELPRSCITAEQMIDRTGDAVRMIGWMYSRKSILTRKQRRRMAFLSLEDRTGTWEAVLFPETYERYARLCREHGPFLLEGRVEMEAGEPMLELTRMERAGVLSQRVAREVLAGCKFASGQCPPKWASAMTRK